MDLLDFAYQIIDLHQEIDDQKRELHKLRDIERKYRELIDADIRHAQEMTGNMLKLFMTPKVVEACTAAAERENGESDE